MDGSAQQSLSSNMNHMSMDVKSENAKNVNGGSVKSQSRYKPEKWMLPDQLEDGLNQLNLAIDGIKEMMKDGKDADVLLSSGKSHGVDWLVGRQGASLTSTPAIPEPYVEQLITKISWNLESEMEAKVNKKVKENMTRLLKKLGEANPDMKLDIGDFCTIAPSDQDENGTITQGGATS